MRHLGAEDRAHYPTRKLLTRHIVVSSSVRDVAPLADDYRPIGKGRRDFLFAMRHLIVEIRAMPQSAKVVAVDWGVCYNDVFKEIKPMATTTTTPGTTCPSKTKRAPVLTPSAIAKVKEIMASQIQCRRDCGFPSSAAAAPVSNIPWPLKTAPE